MAEALPYYERAVQARPQWALPHFHLGKALAALNELTGARAELERAITIDGNKSDYHYQLAQVYRRLGETQKAKAAIARFRSVKQQQERGPAESETAER
jgi:predicted Zn-dependent protease